MKITTTKILLLSSILLIAMTINSCAWIKKIAKRQEPPKKVEVVYQPTEEEQKLIEAIKEQVIVPVILPTSKDSLIITVNPIAKLDTFEEENIGTTLINRRELPSYDINNLPISVWFLKDSLKYVGFIVAGHAEHAVCQIASLEIINKLKEIGQTDNTIFTYGVGYDLRPENLWTPKYDSLLRAMEKNFKNLERKHADQVALSSISLKEYQKFSAMIEKHIKLATSNQTWDTHIVEYKLKNFPLIVPFYYTNTCEAIRFRVKKELFGKIPKESIFVSYEESLTDEQNLTRKSIEENNAQIKEIDSYKNVEGESKRPTWVISYSYASNGKVFSKKETIEGYSSAPDAYTLETTEFVNGKMKTTRTPLTFWQALEYLKDPTIQVYKGVRDSLTFWKDQAQADIANFAERKKVYQNTIQKGNTTLVNHLEYIEMLKQQIKSRDNSDFLIDAFLRGWVVEMGDTTLNNDLDSWYKSQREVVWNAILDSIPNSRINDKLAGVFHSDNVFFHVTSTNDEFIITPYQVTGGEFIQVIDKKIGISHLHSPFNFRFKYN